MAPRIIAGLAVALAALVFSDSLSAHHAARLFETTPPIRVKGTVVRYTWANQPGDVIEELKALGQRASRLVGQTQSSQGRGKSDDSPPVGVNGLEVVIRAAKDAFVADEPLVMNVTFRNTSGAAFRAPDRIRPPQTRTWTLNVEDATTARRFTGVNLRPSGAAPQPGEIEPVPLAAGEAQSSPVTFQMFGFIEGALGYQAARNAYFQRVTAGRGTPRGDEIVRLTGRGTAVPREFQLPPGTYAVSIDVEFPRFPDRPNLPEAVQAAKDRLERDPVPLWKGGAVRSNTVQLRIMPSPKPNP